MNYLAAVRVKRSQMRWLCLGLLASAATSACRKPQSQQQLAPSSVSSYFQGRENNEPVTRHVPPDRWLSQNALNQIFWGSLYKMSCRQESEVCHTILTSSWPKDALTPTEFEKTMHSDYRLDLYLKDCETEAAYWRTQPYRYVNNRSGRPGFKLEPADAEEGTTALAFLDRLGWLERAEQIVAACYESCAPPTHCPGIHDYGSLTHSRCSAIKSYLQNLMKISPDDKKNNKIQTVRIACDQAQRNNQMNQARSQRVSLVFYFPQDGHSVEMGKQP